MRVTTSSNTGSSSVWFPASAICVPLLLYILMGVFCFGSALLYRFVNTRFVGTPSADVWADCKAARMLSCITLSLPAGKLKGRNFGLRLVLTAVTWRMIVPI